MNANEQYARETIRRSNPSRNQRRDPARDRNRARTSCGARQTRPRARARGRAVHAHWYAMNSRTTPDGCEVVCLQCAYEERHATVLDRFDHACVRGALVEMSPLARERAEVARLEREAYARGEPIKRGDE